jgi:hypothetical protein
MEQVYREPTAYDIALFEQDMKPLLWDDQMGSPATMPPDAAAYLRAMEDAARDGVPFAHYSEEQLARLEELADRHLGIGSDFCSGADD